MKWTVVSLVFFPIQLMVKRHLFFSKWGIKNEGMSGPHTLKIILATTICDEDEFIKRGVSTHFHAMALLLRLHAKSPG